MRRPSGFTLDDLIIPPVSTSAGTSNKKRTRHTTGRFTTRDDLRDYVFFLDNIVGVTQNTMGEMTGVSRQNINYIVNNRERGQ